MLCTPLRETCDVPANVTERVPFGANARRVEGSCPFPFKLTYKRLFATGNLAQARTLVIVTFLRTYLHSKSVRVCCPAIQSISTLRHSQFIITSVEAQQAEAVPTPKACSKTSPFHSPDKTNSPADIPTGQHADLPAPRPRPPLDHL